jgi:hypothetical protein
MEETMSIGIYLWRLGIIIITIDALLLFLLGIVALIYRRNHD